MKTIPLTRGKVALVDDKDAEAVLKFKWQAIPSGRRWYAIRFTPHRLGPRKIIQLHRALLGVEDPAVEVDHADGDGLNCQRYNIRACGHPSNMRNRGKFKGQFSSKYKGATLVKQDKWRSSIRFNNRLIFLGYHKAEEDAARAYDAAAIKYFGEFAHLNFPVAPQGTVTLPQTAAHTGA